MPRQWVYPTPTPTGQTLCRCLVLPGGYVNVVADHLQKLANPEIWEAAGTASPVEAAEAIEAALNDWIFRECVVIGEIKLMATDGLPAYMLPCDGAIYLKADYLDLWLLLDTPYEVDVDRFRVPDLRGRVPIGVGGAGPLGILARGDQVGAYEHTLTIPEIPSHDHTSHQHGVDLDVEGPAGLPQPVTGYAFASTTGLTGGGQAHNNVQPGEAVVFAIVARYP